MTGAKLREIMAEMEDQIDGGEECRGRDSQLSRWIMTVLRAAEQIERDALMIQEIRRKLKVLKHHISIDAAIAGMPMHGKSPVVRDAGMFDWLTRHIVSLKVRQEPPEDAPSTVADRHTYQVVNIKISPYGKPVGFDKEELCSIIQMLLEHEQL